MEITIQNLQKKLRIRPRVLQKIVQKILKHERISFHSLSLCFVSSQKIRALNIRYLNRHHTTDVLAFPLSEKKGPFVGEIIISTDAIKQNAKRFGTDVAYEGVLYVVHGVLHLLGYDDHRPVDTEKMRRKEKALMQYLQLDYPKTFLL